MNTKNNPETPLSSRRARRARQPEAVSVTNQENDFLRLVEIVNKQVPAFAIWLTSAIVKIDSTDPEIIELMSRLGLGFLVETTESESLYAGRINYDYMEFTTALNDFINNGPVIESLAFANKLALLDRAEHLWKTDATFFLNMCRYMLGRVKDPALFDYIVNLSAELNMPLTRFEEIKTAILTFDPLLDHKLLKWGFANPELPDLIKSEYRKTAPKVRFKTNGA